MGLENYLEEKKLPWNENANTVPPFPFGIPNAERTLKYDFPILHNVFDKFNSNVIWHNSFNRQLYLYLIEL